MPTDSRCRRDAEAWATENLGFIGREENRAGRTELMPRFTEACVESGSGVTNVTQNKKRLYFLEGLNF